MYNTSNTYLGKPDIKHQDWFDSNDQELQTLMSRTVQAHQRVLPTRSSIQSHGSIQRCLQTATNTHPCTEVRLVGKAVELQRASTMDLRKCVDPKRRDLFN